MFLGLPPGGITLPDVHLAPPTATAAGGARPPSSLTAHKEAPSPPAPSAGAALSAAAGLPVSQVPPGSSSSSFTFTMANNSSSKHFRYKWPDHPHLRFYPSVGHLHAGQVREVTVTFVASAPVRLDGQDIKLALSQITYKVCSLVLVWLPEQREAARAGQRNAEGGARTGPSMFATMDMNMRIPSAPSSTLADLCWPW